MVGVGVVVSDDVSPRIIVTADWRYCLSDHWYMMYDSLTQTMRSSSNYIQPGLLYLLISTYFCQFRCYNLTLLHLKLVPKFLPRTWFKNVQIKPPEAGDSGDMSGMLGRCGWWQWQCMDLWGFRSVSPSLCSKSQSNCVQSNLTNRIRKLYSICPLSSLRTQNAKFWLEVKLPAGDSRERRGEVWKIK